MTFTSASTPSRGAITKTKWDLDGDGVYDLEGTQVSRAFGAGAHTVAMRVTQENGRQAVAFAGFEVAEATASASACSSDPGAARPQTGTILTTPQPKPKPKSKPPSRMRPFPVVRIAGVVLPDGARVSILSVRAPRGSSVLARCRGRGCPARAVARSSVASLVRIHRFERRLRAGVTLELFVRKGARIGKYTRFRIRAGRPPARVDRCLMPGRARPVRCP